MPATLALLLLAACRTGPAPAPDGAYAVVLGIAQDGGVPHTGCSEDRCRAAWQDPTLRRLPSSVALVDGDTTVLLDATPALPDQLQRVGHDLDAVFPTHAHIGHYTGLMYLGTEVWSTDRVPVYAMPRMAALLATSGPWSELVRKDQIEVVLMHAGEPVEVGRFTVTPLPVRHRDELSETVAFEVRGPERALLYLPDIDTWDGFALEETLDRVDVALLDGTFYADGELVGRDMSGIPHPRISATVERLRGTQTDVRFIHLNHTNPALDPGSPERNAVEAGGMRVAAEGDVIPL